jgi:hypothetical protein
MSKSLSRCATALASALCFALATVLLALPASVLAETCPNEQFRTGPSANLPDCRAYELVTPPFKEAALAPLRSQFGLHGFASMSADGLHVVVNSLGNFGDAHASLGANSYELTRAGSGWSETNVDLPASQFPASAIIHATPDFGAFLYEARTTEQSLKAKDFWIREADGALRDLGPFEPPSSTLGPPGTGFGVVDTGGQGGSFKGASVDLSHVVFETASVTSITNGYPDVSWPGDAPGNLYQYTAGQSGPPVLVGVGPSGGPCLAEYSGMSEDGSRIFFEVGTAGCSSVEPPVSELFARVEESHTVAISEPSEVDCSACDTGAGVLAPATFNGASADGSKVFFTTTQPLLGSDISANIYEYDFDAPPASPGDPDGRIIQVTGGEWASGGARVQDSVKVSEDGSHLYFIAQGALSQATNNQGQSPTAGEENLYVFERDAQFPSGRLSFIATLSPSGLQAWSPEHNVGLGATVTPDGRFLAFTSAADLTPDDTSTAEQVFEYDAQTGELVRVSIGQNGFNDNGNTDTFNAEIPRQLSRLSSEKLPLAISNDGAYVVFQSADGLTPGALNGYLGEVEFPGSAKTIGFLNSGDYYANNVYEYHDGNVYLVSDGRDTTYSHEHDLESAVKLGGMSPAGTDVFFETVDRLVPQDQDTEVDLYDARIGGGFPAPVSLLPSCSGDACQGQLSPSPTLLSPGSEFQAGGNPPLASEPAPAAKLKPKAKAKLKRCKKGKTLKRGKCVKAKAKKSNRGVSK